MHAFVQHAVMGNDVGGIAGHEQTPDVRVDKQQVFGQITAIHFGHDHVGQQQVDRTAVLMGQADSCGCQNPLNFCSFARTDDMLLGQAREIPEAWGEQGLK